MKKFENWKHEPLSKFLKVGDEVDQGFVDYFRNTLPPATDRSNLIQIGEPYSHVNGYATFATLSKVNGKWVYCGHCYRGSSECMDE